MVRDKSGERSVSVFPTHPRWLVLPSGRSGLTGKLTNTDSAITYQNNIMLFVTPNVCISIVFSFSWELKWPQEKLKKKNFNNQNGQLGNSEIPSCPGFSQHTNTSIKAHLVSRPFSFHLPFSEVSVMANLDVLLRKVYKRL